MTYIQYKWGSELETVDQFDTYKEALAMLKEYRMSNSMGHYYLSQRACKSWK